MVFGRKVNNVQLVLRPTRDNLKWVKGVRRQFGCFDDELMIQNLNEFRLGARHRVFMFQSGRDNIVSCLD